MRDIALIMIHTAAPQAVGIKKASAVHLTLLVSFFTVRSVVEQGQCIRENTITQRAVVISQPFETSNSRSSKSEEYSQSVLFCIYAISIMGITISLAGKPNTKAVRITPSIPISFPKGSIASVQCMSRVLSPAVTFAKIHITIPAGAATLTALPSTNKVRSNTERIIVLPICGLR